MKSTITAIILTVAASSASAWLDMPFFGNDNGYNNGNGFSNMMNDFMGNGAGNGNGSGEGEFTFSFTAKAKAKSDFDAKSHFRNQAASNGYGYQTPYYGYAPVAPVAPQAPVAPAAK